MSGRSPAACRIVRVMGDFLGHNFATILQLIVTLWMASIARQFQLTLATYGTRLEAHREAVRRSRVLWWLGKDAGDATDVLNEMMDWFAVNEVYLSPRAAQAFKAVHMWKGLVITVSSITHTKEYNEADAALSILREELLRFRKRTIRDIIGERRFSAERRKKA